jgi:hypothetical protein
MKAVHPDSGSAPDTALAVLLNQARAVALAGMPEPTTALVPLETVMDLVRAQTSEAMRRTGAPGMDPA